MATHTAKDGQVNVSGTVIQLSERQMPSLRRQFLSSVVQIRSSIWTEIRPNE
jgi:hypothetical protein